MANFHTVDRIDTNCVAIVLVLRLSLQLDEFAGVDNPIVEATANTFCSEGQHLNTVVIEVAVHSTVLFDISVIGSICQVLHRRSRRLSFLTRTC